MGKEEIDWSKEPNKEDIWADNPDVLSNKPKLSDEKLLDEPKKHKHRKGKVLDKEVDIHFNLRSALKFGLFIILIVGIFFIGRLSASELTLQVTVPDFSDLGFSGAATVDSTSETTETVAEETSTEATNKTSEETEETTTETEEETTIIEPEVEEEHSCSIDDYKRVALSIDNVEKSWKGTWGKITRVKYTIKNNNADCTAKPSSFIMLVEGYDDIETDVPFISFDVESGKTKKATVIVPKGGFSYNEVTTGDLSSVEVTIRLYDEDGNIMGQSKRNVNIAG